MPGTNLNPPGKKIEDGGDIIISGGIRLRFNHNDSEAAFDIVDDEYGLQARFQSDVVSLFGEDLFAGDAQTTVNVLGTFTTASLWLYDAGLEVYHPIQISDGVMFLDIPMYYRGKRIVRQHSQYVGDGTNTSFVLDHQLETSDLNISVIQVSNMTRLDPTQYTWSATSPDNANIVFNTAPAIAQYLVIVMG